MTSPLSQELFGTNKFDELMAATESVHTLPKVLEGLVGMTYKQLERLEKAVIDNLYDAGTKTERQAKELREGKRPVWHMVDGKTCKAVQDAVWLIGMAKIGLK